MNMIGLSHVGGACLLAIFIVLFIGGHTQNEAWIKGLVYHNKWLVLLIPTSKDIPIEDIVPCVLLTRYYVMCQGTATTNNRNWKDWAALGGPNENFEVYNGSPSGQIRKLNVQADYKGYCISKEFEENFTIFVAELEEPFDEDQHTEIVPLLLVRSWPPDFNIKAVFLAYRTITYGEFEAVHVNRTLISPVPCYARMSRWTGACITQDERNDLCHSWTHNNKKRDTTPQSIILVQGGIFGFFSEEWDRFGWRCHNDRNPYFYGTSVLSIASIVSWIQSFICSEAVVLLPLDLPHMENFSSGVNPHMRGSGDTFISALYGSHACCGSGCSSVYDTKQIMLVFLICTVLIWLSLHKFQLCK